MALTYINEKGEEKEDLIGLDAFLGEFNSIVENSSYSVYGLTGGWGTGKSIFINIWERSLTKNNYIHIDAFAKDYENDAFLVLFSSVYKYLEQQNTTSKQILKQFFDDSKRFLMNAGKATGKFIFNTLTDKIIGSESLKTFISDLLDTYCDDILQKCIEEENIHDSLVKTLEKITVNLSNPLYIIIDELDRCRPSFALEMLEKVKHIFSVTKIKFILVYNPEIFDKVIEKEYGLKNGGSRYLNKFIEKTISFKQPISIRKWLYDEIENNIERFKFLDTKSHLKNTIDILIELKNEYNISYRDFSRIISKIKHYDISNLGLMIVLLTVEFTRHIRNDELEDMIAYIKQNNGFAINAPDRFISNSIYKKFSIILNGNENDKKQLFNDTFKYFVDNGLI